MHPGVGPEAEAEAIYVQQLGLAERLRGHQGEFVVWDVGLGAAANGLTVLRATRDTGAALRLISFEQTLEPLQFAFDHRAALGYFRGYEPAVKQLLSHAEAEFRSGRSAVRWELHLADFPALLRTAAAQAIPKPHAILYDPWSPAKNPGMWTAPLFADLFRLLDPARPCVLPTYSRSTMLRVALLLAGFQVGAGRAAGRKEETTLAANLRGRIAQPLDGRWLERARRSPSAEPLWEAAYRQAPLAPVTEARLRRHPQFQ